MLTKVTLDNFKSFKKKTTIDLMKTNYTILPQNVTSEGVLKGCIFVGANASGKSTIILAIKLLLDLLFLEKNLTSSFWLCVFGNKPTYSITYEFLIEGKAIKYSLVFDTMKFMISEKLYLDDKLMLERIGLSAKSYIAEDSGVSYDETDIGKDTLFLRTLYFNTKFASNAILEAWMSYLKKATYINMFDRKLISYNNAEVSLIEFLDHGGCQIVNNFFDEYNFQQNIEYDHSSKGSRLEVVVLDDDHKKSIFFKRKGIEEPIPFPEESLGNKNLLRMLPPFFSAIKNGGMLLIDEFSSGFHNDLESLMVRYFMEKSKTAQLIFVSHSTNLLSNYILRPDQEYSVEFHGDEGSSVNRFSSEQPRSAQNIEKMYVSGVFGGIPKYKEVEDEVK